MGVGHLIKRSAVFLDRDGVLNECLVGPDGVSRPPSDLGGFRLLRGVSDACRELRALGFLLIVVTNQPDVARGTQTRDVVEAINSRLREEVELDEIRVCYHDDRDGCDCRKPKPGLLLSAAKDWGIDLASSFMVGDRCKDIEAGRRAGCTTILIDPGREQPHETEPTVTVDSLLNAAAWIRDRLLDGRWAE